jgi:hypothetical protein
VLESGDKPDKYYQQMHSIAQLEVKGKQYMNEKEHLEPNQWREDLQFFADETQKHHKNPFHFVSKEQFESATAALYEQISSLKKYEIVVELQRIAAMIGDGHTFLSTWDIHHFYPLELFWFKDELRVIRTASTHQEVLGMRLAAINRVNITEVFTRIQSVIPQGENEWYVLQQSVGQIIRAELLVSLGIVSQIEQALFTFQDDLGGPLTVTIDSIAPDTKLDWIPVSRNPPLYQQRPGESFWFVNLSDNQTLYVHFHNYTDLEQHARRLWEFVDDHRPKRLIVDMRQNGGGNYTLGRSHLIYEIQKRPDLNSTGCLFVIIGRATFSAAMTNVTDFRRETDAILVGEPTGARPRGYQENYWFTLPNSGLHVSLASRYYKFQEADTPAVMPDHLIEPNWTDYKAGRDPVLEWILSY